MTVWFCWINNRHRAPGEHTGSPVGWDAANAYRTTWFTLHVLPDTGILRLAVVTYTRGNGAFGY